MVVNHQEGAVSGAASERPGTSIQQRSRSASIRFVMMLVAVVIPPILVQPAASKCGAATALRQASHPTNTRERDLFPHALRHSIGRPPPARLPLGQRVHDMADGPRESTVSLNVLGDQITIAEAREARAVPASHQHEARQRVSLHRRFFTAGIITILTAGAGWGALLLWQLGTRGSFTGISVHHINAHGHAQIFGWVALFIMGFAYEVFPRLWRAQPVNPVLAQCVFVSMLIGLLLNIFAIASPALPASFTLALVGGVIQTAACIAFAAQITNAAMHRDELNAHVAGRRGIDASTAFILAALGWLIVMSGYSTWHTLAVLAAPSDEALFWQLRTWQSALRDVQIHGLAMFMILGVSIRLLPGMFGLPKANEKHAWVAFALLVAAVLLECALLIVSQLTENFAIAAGLLVPWLLLPIGVSLIIWPWTLWKPVRFPDRSAKFVRAAYAWLFVSFGILLYLPIDQWMLGVPFSHACYGAARHAITVGFVSMMIVGISSKMAPGLRGMSIASLPELWTPFMLINVGCAMRVTLQIASDWTPIAFRFIGISGTLELAGLAFWAAHLIRVMWFAPKKDYGAKPPALRQPSINAANAQ